MAHQENIFLALKKHWKFQAGKMDHLSFSFQKLILMLKLKKKSWKIDSASF